jgi:large subunit ribosomal protein L1
MNKESIQKALSELGEQPKRKFSQSFDLVINLKNIVIKQNPVDFFVTLHYPKGRKIKVAAFVDQELTEQAQKNCDLLIKEAYDYFIAQASLMPKVAANFGKVLGIRGKMPNPKLGCVVPPNANLEPLVTKLNKTVRLSAKRGTNLQCMIGKQDQAEDQIIDNILTIYQAALKQLPNDTQNIKSIILKLTMGKPIKIR